MNSRFLRSLASLGVPDGAELGIAVSGGPDSLALLLLAIKARPGLVRAATVDHGLRPEARGEADQVAAICHTRGVPHDILTVSVAGNVQSGAREARYTALGDWCVGHGLAWLATGHHADDQAETMIMRLARGSGLTGLAGIRRHRKLRPGVSLVRPLLDWQKAKLVELVTAAGLDATTDPSNADPAYDRTHVRALLERTPWLDPARIAATAGHLADSEAALDWMTEKLAAERIEGDSLDPSGLPPELLRRLVLRLLARFRLVPRGPDLVRLIEALRNGRAATLGAVKVSPGARWTVAPAPPRRTNP